MAGTFTMDPVLESLRFWLSRLAVEADITVAPYGQLLPSLFASESGFGHVGTPRLFFLRRSDIARDKTDTQVRDVLEAIIATDTGGPTLLAICPEPDGSASDWADAPMEIASHIEVMDVADVFDVYGVDEPFDPDADRAGHIPYTAEAMAVLGTLAARWLSRIMRPAVKLIAVDGDQTLWGGVLGEDGIDGVRCDEGHQRLQEGLKQAGQSGQILALISKNEGDDIDALFAKREDFPLKADDFLVQAVGWAAKTDSLAAIAQDFGVDEQAILFLDDSPVEIAAIRAAMPGVLTVRVPEGVQFSAFTDHLWPLDTGPLTDADQQRIETYRDEMGRQAAAISAPDIDSFFASLNLEVEVQPATMQDVPRLSQLSIRTNQFNTTLERLQDADIRPYIDDFSVNFLTVAVQDRFGDYGVVGMMRACPQGDTLHCDMFVLSCRALGRGVEHSMLNALAELARAQGLSHLRLDYKMAERNSPVLMFLSHLTDTPLTHEGAVILPVDKAAEIRFSPAHFNSTPSVKPVRTHGMSKVADAGSIYGWIATEMTTGEDILSAMTASRRSRPDLPGPYIEPSPGLEEQIAEIWGEVLLLHPVGAHDDFHALGGRSIQLVRMNTLLKSRLGIQTDITALFRFGTVATLCQYLQSRDERGGPARGRERGLINAQATQRLAERRRSYSRGQ